MAEGMLRAWGGERFEAESAGSVATEVRPLAIKAMAEIGIDITRQTSKTTDAFAGQAFDYAITVCDESREACPYFPGTTQLHWAFDDPSAATGTDDERLAVFRRVRDDIGARIRSELLAPG
jgi:arsenate reductase